MSKPLDNSRRENSLNTRRVEGTSSVPDDPPTPRIPTDGRERTAYAGIHRGVPRRELLGDLAVFFLWFAVVAVAAWLTPDPSGHGTHTQLGFPPCSMLVLTGRPCPSCGLTTSFTATVHGRFAEAFSAHPLGPLLFLWFTVFALYSFSKFVLGYKLRLPDGLALKVNLGLLAVFVAYGTWRWIAGL